MTVLPKALVFDWDNTLVDTWSVIHKALDRTFVAMGMRPWNLAETKQRVRSSARDAFPRLFGDRAEQAERIFYQSYETEHLSALRPLPGACELIAALSGNKGLFLSLLSNKKGELLRREVSYLGWDDQFGAIVGALDAERDKPAREALIAALAHSGASPGNEVWIVGDTDIDMDCAARHGCQAVLLRPEKASESEFGGFKPLAWAPGCPELLEHFRAIGLARNGQ